MQRVNPEGVAPKKGQAAVRPSRSPPLWRLPADVSRKYRVARGWHCLESPALRCETQLACGADARGAEVVDISSNQSGQLALRFASRAIARSADVAWLRSQLRSRGQRIARYQSGGTSAARKHKKAFGIRGPSASGFIL
jgi:hypothetical protein